MYSSILPFFLGSTLSGLRGGCEDSYMIFFAQIAQPCGDERQIAVLITQKASDTHLWRNANLALP